MKKIKTLIVEDEPKSLKLLAGMLTEYHPNVEIVATAGSVKEAKRAADGHEFELLFVDVTLPDGNGFEVLEYVKPKGPEIVFTTAYEHFAAKAFDYQALHYLLKPITPDDLAEAIQRFEKRRDAGQIPVKSTDAKPTRISLRSNEGIVIAELADIIMIQAASKYSIVHFTNRKELIISKSLSKFEELLSDAGFYRIHDSHLVNMDHIRSYTKGKGGTVELSNGAKVEVSFRKRDDFLDILNKYTRIVD